MVNNTTIPAEFLTSGGIGDATYILQDFHKRALSESSRAREMEHEVIMQLTGLRSDLQQKIKEIKSLSGDFKNSVDKEIEGSRQAVRHLQEALGLVDADPSAIAGKGDPFIVKLGVDRQIERQIEEENYLHRVWACLSMCYTFANRSRHISTLSLQVANWSQLLLAKFRKHILHMQASLSVKQMKHSKLPTDSEKDRSAWQRPMNGRFLSPTMIIWLTQESPSDRSNISPIQERIIQLRQKFEVACLNEKANTSRTIHQDGMWHFILCLCIDLTLFVRYTLSPTHLHEFKSADRISSQAPIMSLYLPEQKLGSHSEPGSSSHKFMLKGRQTGGMHRGHAWVFRAESYDTMMAWFADIKELTEKSGKERDAFVRRSHARSLSGGSMKAQSIGGSSDGGLEEDEADAQPYSSEQSVRGASAAAVSGRHGADHQYDDDAQAGQGAYGYGDERPDPAGWRPSQRPSPGGRFPSDLNVHRGLQAPLSPSSGESSTERDRDAIAAAGALPGSGMPFTEFESTQQQQQPVAAAANYTENEKSKAYTGDPDFQERAAGHIKPKQHSSTPPQRDGQQQQYSQPQQEFTPSHQQYFQPQEETREVPSQFTADPDRTQNPRDYAAPAAAGAGLGGAAIGAAAMYHHDQQPQSKLQHQQQPHSENVTEEMDHASAVPAPGTSSAPIMTEASTAMSPIIPVHTNPRPASSSLGDTEPLSTVPTSIGSVGHGSNIEASQQMEAPMPTARQMGTKMSMLAQPSSELDQDGSGSGNITTKPTPLRTVTVGTISDLHIPGEYPRTPKLAQ